MKLYVSPELRLTPAVGKVRAGAQTSFVAALTARAEITPVRRATNFMVDKEKSRRDIPGHL